MGENDMTTTTKYELTDADRKRLDAIAQKANGKPKVDDIAWKIACDWFATLPVVSREAVERALGAVTEKEAERYDHDYLSHKNDSLESNCYALGRFLASRRAMLDDAAGKPPKAEPTPEPQPTIDVVAELAELRKAVGLMLESQGAQRGAIQANSRRHDLQAEWIKNLKLRVAALESAAQRRPWWRRW